jgi:hypothetical protein
MTQILRFEMNVPAEVALKHPGPGKPIEGRYGNRVMYTLADDRVMYVAPIVASQITDLGIQPGERFQVRKHLKKQGSKRLIEWDVQRVASEPETQLERELRESIVVAQTSKATPSSEVTGESNPEPPSLESTPPNATPAPATVSMPTDSRDGNASAVPQNGNRVPAGSLEDTLKPASSVDHARTEVGSAHECSAPTAPAPTSAAVPIANGSTNGSQSSTSKNGNNPPPVTTKLEHALKTAISAAHNAEKYSAELGYVVRFDADAIKSMAITVLINMSEGNRR